MTLRHLSLFSCGGIGTLASQAAGVEEAGEESTEGR